MKIVVWKSYGDIDVYAIETVEQFENLVKTMIDCVEDWGLDPEIDPLLKYMKMHPGNYTALAKTFDRLVEIVEPSSHEQFEQIFRTVVQE